MDVRDAAKKDYLEGMKYQEICEKHNLSINTLKSWVKRHGWAAEKKNKNTKGAHKKKRGAPFNNKNAVGNKGGAAPAGNKNAETHGFFSKYLPEETFAIMQEIQEKDPLDLLWENIVIQYTAIIRAQRIMYVRDQDDLTEALKREKETHGAESSGWEREYELQFAWDKQATFLQAQSRAMSELRSMIRQYDELLKSGLATEEQRLRIEKLKVDIEKVKDPEGDKPIEVIIKRKGDG